jgi:maltose-binding protein MalE
MKQRRSVVLLLGLALLAAACGGGAAPSGTTGAPGTEAPATTAPAVTETTAAPVGEGLLIWADETKAQALEQVVPAFTEQTGVPVEIQVVDFGQIRDQVKTAGPAGEGPDLFTGAHDWTGELVTAGVVDPIDLGAKAGEFAEEIALNVFSIEGQLYAVPYATEAVAMYHNKALAAEPPATFEEVRAACDGMSGIENCYGVPGGGDAADAYHNFPFLSAFGGYIFNYDPATGHDPSDVGIDSEGALAGGQFLASLVADGYVGETNYDTARNLFIEGSQPFWMTGPWELGGLGDTEVDWGVALIPTMDGNSAKPFVGGQGFFLSSFSENKVVAQSFLLEFVATAEGMMALHEADPRIPVFTATLEEVSADPAVQVFSESMAGGEPMPNIPQMGSVWGPLGDALLQVRNGDADPEAALTAAAEQVRQAVAG